jgi:hypothetical protein
MNIFKNDNSILLKVLLLFYALIGSSSLQPLLSKQWNGMIEKDRMTQHILGVTTIITLIILLSDGKLSNMAILGYTLFCYLWFLLSTKMDIHWNMMVVILLLVGYLYENSIRMRENKIDSDRVLTVEEKEKIKKNSNINRSYIVGGIMGVTITGLLLYSNKKEVQYGGGYSVVNFLLY